MSTTGVPSTPVAASSCDHGGTPHTVKKLREAASFQRKKFGNHTMPAGSQSPNSTRTECTTVREPVPATAETVAAGEAVPGGDVGAMGSVLRAKCDILVHWILGTARCHSYGTILAAALSILAALHRFRPRAAPHHAHEPA